MTAPDDTADRLVALEADNARLRRLLDASGVPENLRHAFRDTVVLLRAIMRRSAETAEDVEGYLAHLEGRLDALARVRSRTDEYGEADLHTLISDELLFHLVREGDRASIEGPTVRLRPKAAQVLAMAVHELASNAVEHGPLARSEGTVTVAWRLEAGPGDPVLELDWKETGATGLAGPARRGFGTSVLEDMLAYDLKARAVLAFELDGLHYAARIPMTVRLGRTLETAGDVGELRPVS